jgi:hypothetical protein
MRVIKKRKSERLVACGGTPGRSGCGVLLGVEPKDLVQRDDRSSDYVPSWEYWFTCPKCGERDVLVMPTTYCQCMYECRGCGAAINRKPGYCCVFCSYSDKTCPTREIGWCRPPFASSLA